VRLSADQRGGRIVIEVSDDGAGIDAERVLKKAREKGLVDESGALSNDEINNPIFLPGFSTVETVSEISGSVAFILDIEKLPELAQEAESQPPRSAMSLEIRLAAA
jgi:hypothetical protein